MCRVHVCNGCMCVSGASVCWVHVCVGCMCVGVHVCVVCKCASDTCLLGCMCVLGASVCRGHVISGTCKPESSKWHSCQNSSTRGLFYIVKDLNPKKT